VILIDDDYLAFAISERNKDATMLDISLPAIVFRVKEVDVGGANSHLLTNILDCAKIQLVLN
jgi:hypothetical protein